MLKLLNFYLLHVILLSSFTAHASEVWVRTTVLDHVLKNFNSQNKVPQVKWPSWMKECLVTATQESPDYESKCKEQLGEYKESSEVKDSLLGSHVSCAMSCYDPGVRARSCLIEKFEDSNGLEQRPFLLLFSKDHSRTLGERVFIDEKTSLLGAIAVLQSRAASEEICIE